jgi:hypothetical protein
MKKLFFTFASAAALLFVVSCSKTDKEKQYNIYNSVYYANGVDNYYYYDDILTEKPEIKFDTANLRKEIEDAFPYQTLFSNYGPGKNGFYFIVMIDKNNRVEYRFMTGLELRPEMGWLSSCYDKEILSTHTNWRKRGAINLFVTSIPDTNKIFATKLGKIDGKEVPSLTLYELSADLSTDGKVLSPWELTPTNFTKFRPVYYKNQNNTNVGRYFSLTDFHTTEIREKAEKYFALLEFEQAYQKKKQNINIPNNSFFARTTEWTHRSSDAILKEGWGAFYKNLYSYPGVDTVKMQGTVVTKLFIDKNGSVIGTQLLKGLNEQCDKAVAEVFKSTRFFPLDTLATLVAPIYFGGIKYRNDVDLCLEIGEPELVGREKRDFKEGDEINFHIKVTNKAKSLLEFNELNITIYVNDSLRGLIYGPFKRFTSEEHWFYWPAKKKGTYNYTITVDPNNQLGDKDLSNNIISGTFEVK